MTNTTIETILSSVDRSNVAVPKCPLTFKLYQGDEKAYVTYNPNERVCVTDGMLLMVVETGELYKFNESTGKWS